MVIVNAKHAFKFLHHKGKLSFRSSLKNNKAKIKLHKMRELLDTRDKAFLQRDFNVRSFQSDIIFAKLAGVPTLNILLSGCRNGF